MTSCRPALVGLILVASLTLSGCATLHLPWIDKVPEASPKNPVVQITCLWEPSAGHDPNGVSCRGFAGQILFLGNKGGMPVKIDGDVMVYVFDDQGTPDEQAVPVHQFHFDAGAWNRHLRVGSLGPTYHVFIPYTRSGRHEAICSLRLKLTNPDGSTLYSDHSEIPLETKTRTKDVSTAEVISHRGKRAEGESLDGPRTTTIPLNGRDRPDPTTSEEFDQERANFLLQQFLREQSHKELDSQRTSSAVNRDGASERIRTSSVADDISGDLSQPAPKRIRGMAYRHPLGDEAAFPLPTQVADLPEADESPDPLDGQTSQIER
jgi:hypothetical protein